MAEDAPHCEPELGYAFPSPPESSPHLINNNNNIDECLVGGGGSLCDRGRLASAEPVLGVVHHYDKSTLTSSAPSSTAEDVASTSSRSSHTTTTASLNHEAMSTSSIADFFTDKHVFITGATGFVGQALMEKILRSCPKVSKLYLLVREKRGCAIQDRITKILNTEAFNRLRDEQPDFAQKVLAVGGDISDPGLGLSREDRQLLVDNVNVVVHSAATVKFDEALRKAILMNLCAVDEIIRLCKEIKNLDVLIHISTAYSNAVRSSIDEVFYPSPIKPQQMIEAVKWMDDATFDQITPRLIGAMPNTYTFTKQLAETLLQERAAHLPVAIIRPSIITPAWQDPYPGWTCSWYGPTGMYIAMGKGLLRVMHCNLKAITDCIPVDLVVNSILAATWYTGTYKPEHINIYNVATGAVNPHTWDEIQRWGVEHLYKEPFEGAFRSPYTLFTQNRLLVSACRLFWHTIPAHIGDTVMKIMGKKPRLVRIYDQLHKGMESLAYFTSRQWHFGFKNLDTLMGNMSYHDRQEFCVDPRLLEWQSYFVQYSKGVKRFLLKESLSGVPAALAHNKMLRRIEVMMNALGVLIVWRFCQGRTNLLHYLNLLLKTILLPLRTLLHRLTPV